MESLVGQVWSPDVRPLVEEAWRCYNAGRHAGATWTAVTTDIITKLVHLANHGDAAAIPFRAELTKAQAKGLTVAGVRTM